MRLHDYNIWYLPLSDPGFAFEKMSNEKSQGTRDKVAGSCVLAGSMWPSKWKSLELWNVVGCDNITPAILDFDPSTIFQTLIQQSIMTQRLKNMSKILFR